MRFSLSFFAAFSLLVFGNIDAASSNEIEVRCVQSGLLRAGYDPNGVDGKVGAGTRRAASEYASAKAVDLPEISKRSAAVWCRELSDDTIEVVVGPRSNQEIVDTVQLTLEASRELLNSEFGYSAPVVRAYVSNNAKWMTDIYLQENELPNRFRAGKLDEFSRCEPSAEAGIRAMFLCLGNPRWSDRSRAIHATAHEYWHSALQYDLVNQRCCTDSNAMSLFGPEWLVEGSAELFGIMAKEKMGVSKRIIEMLGFKAETPNDVDLMRLRTRAGYRENEGWNYAPLAAQYLYDRTGPASFVEYYRGIAEGEQIGTAFQNAFGLSEQEFSDQFRKFVNG